MDQNFADLNEIYSVIFGLNDTISKICSGINSGKYNIIVYKKGESDSFTNLDYFIQLLFESIFKKHFPLISIVGEEDLTKIVDYSEFSEYLNNLDFPILNEVTKIDFFQDRFIDQTKLKVFIDPIDSTRNFIKKNFQPVTTLIGFTYEEKPIFGFIHYPLHQSTQAGKTYFSIAKKGVFIRENDLISQVNYKNTRYERIPILISLNRSDDKLKSYFNNNSYETKFAGGLGNKLISAIENNYVYVSTGAGLGYWDICAGHAICQELGGFARYNNGDQILYSSDSNLVFLKDKIIIAPDQELGETTLKYVQENKIF